MQRDIWHGRDGGNMTAEGTDQSDPAARERVLAAGEAGGGEGRLLWQSLWRERGPADSLMSAQ